ncbi:MAG TPA: transcription termination/antitermination NusG family protein [Thermoanaerobaculia bacterium]|nr:transcription termination/antitermination NusG family protein [Thermoanaerobaculia bacterium]
MPILKREPEIYPQWLFDEPPPGRWWVAYVRSRQEKRLARHLHYCRVPYYLPQQEQRVRRQGRWRVSHLPLFPGYVFFRGHSHHRIQGLESNLVVRTLAGDDHELLDGELRELWRLQCSGSPLVAHAYLGPGAAVEVIHGPFKGYRGLVVREKGTYRLVVSITMLRKSVAAELDREVLAPAAAEVDQRRTA